MGDDTEGAKEALKRDWEQTKADMPGDAGKELDQDADDTVRQAVGKEEPPPEDVSNPS